MSRDDDPAVLGWLRAKPKRARGSSAYAPAPKVGRRRPVCSTASARRPTGTIVARNAEAQPDDRICRRTGGWSSDGRRDDDRHHGLDADDADTDRGDRAAGQRRKRSRAISDFEQWDARHASGAFKLTRPLRRPYSPTGSPSGTGKELGVRLEPGMDEVSLALVADAWSRTYRSNATTYAASPDAVVSRNGVRVTPTAGTDWPEDRRVSTFPDRKPADALDLALDAITARYGERTTDVVAMQLEYPRR